ncbi:flagellar biosynthetic protein FliR [Pelagicoccus sp. SDUM812003]|uniref:flagellar biosynthetic protein FliR n=1 Tax=Pelagicoccus sp. SDUM812003 TaxID=3041267 RepID=UPI00280F264C|nr:flagellar biosynthetic protein FliR [Pelagicoccus sp. SDUM812003]MDQ8202545.1 flagellar biosynthetic protein FliR [Pelagicoccus sp. SDUM812003]
MFTIGDILVFMMVLARVLGMFMIAPVFSHKTIPAIAKVTLAAAFGFMAMPLVGDLDTQPISILELVVWTAKEIAVGLSIGIAIRMIFFVLDFAAHVLTMQIGLMPGPEFDPSSASSQGNPLGTIIYFFGLMMLLSGTEYDILRAFIMSFEVAPIGYFTPNSFAADTLVLKTADIFKIGVLMSAPVIAVNFLINLIFATLGKVVPKLNVFILSFSVRIFIGTSVLVVTIGLIAHYAMNYLHETPEMMLRFIFFRPEA